MKGLKGCVRAAAAALAMLAAGGAALAQGAAAQYPERPVRLVVAFAPGGLADITFRMVADKLTELLGRQVVVENAPGAGGIAAANAVLRAKPDGHALLVVTNGTAISKGLFKSLPFDPLKDFVPVSLVGLFDIIIVTRADGPHRTLADLIAAAKAAPGKLNFGTINPGSTQNLSAELFKSTVGIDVPVIPFRTSPDAFTAALGGQIDAVFEAYAAAKALVDGGKLVALAASGPKRSEYLPNVPTTREAGAPNYEVVGWNGIAAPAGTPPEIVAVLNRHVNTVVAMPDIRKRFLGFGIEAVAGTPEDLGRRFAADIERWSAVIRDAKIPQQ